MNKLARYAVSGVSGKVDLAARTITGVAIATLGPVVGNSKCEADDETLRTILKCAAKTVRSRVDHPEDVRDPSSVKVSGELGTLVGTFDNFRVDGEKVLADFYAVSDAANPEATKLLHLANDVRAAQCFGVSMVCMQHVEKNKIRVEELFSIDWVDVPALNPNGVFSASEKETTIMADPLKPEKGEDGKYYVTCNGAKYEVEMPPEKKKEDEEEAKPAQNAATGGDENATQKDLSKMGAEQAVTHLQTLRPDVANLLRGQGEASARQYAADFETAMTAAGLKGEARVKFAQKFNGKPIDDVKQYAVLTAAAENKALGEGGGTGAAQTTQASADAEAPQRFAAEPALRRAFGVQTTDANSDAYKAGLAKYQASLARSVPAKK